MPRVFATFTGFWPTVLGPAVPLFGQQNDLILPIAPDLPHDPHSGPTRTLRRGARGALHKPPVIIARGSRAAGLFSGRLEQNRAEHAYDSVLLRTRCTPATKAYP